MFTQLTQRYKHPYIMDTTCRYQILIISTYEGIFNVRVKTNFKIEKIN